MELHELHVRHPGTGPPGHGDAIPAGDRRVGGEHVDLAGPPGGEHHHARGVGLHLPADGVEHVGPHCLVVFRRELALSPRHPAPGHHVHGHVVVQQLDGRLLPNLGVQGPHHLPPRHVGGVQDAAMAVAPLLVQVVLVGVRRPARELGPPGNQLADPLGTLTDRLFHGLAPAEPRPGDQGVGDVRVEIVVLVPHRRDTALGVSAVALQRSGLGDHGHRSVAARLQREPHARHA